MLGDRADNCVLEPREASRCENHKVAPMLRCVVCNAPDGMILDHCYCVVQPGQVLVSNILKGILTPANDALPYGATIVIESVDLVVNKWMNCVQESYFGRDRLGPEAAAATGCRPRSADESAPGS